jgi:hypothetical protein
MLNRSVFISLFLTSSLALAQGGGSVTPAHSLEAPTTLPIVFTKTISADDSRIGDAVAAKTSQVVHLANGMVIPSGAKVSGHVIATGGFIYDTTPYARQKPSILSIQFDAVQADGETLPLHVTVRAIADPITSAEARRPLATDIDPDGTMTQIGGDQFTPWQKEVVSNDGDVVAYNKRGGVYAHLIANGSCDGSDVEVSVGIYSASACGVYGFARVSAAEMGSLGKPSVLTLVSTHVSPKIWKNSTALLEELPAQEAVASR